MSFSTPGTRPCNCDERLDDERGRSGAAHSTAPSRLVRSGLIPLLLAMATGLWVCGTACDNAGRTGDPTVDRAAALLDAAPKDGKRDSIAEMDRLLQKRLSEPGVDDALRLEIATLYGRAAADGRLVTDKERSIALARQARSEFEQVLDADPTSAPAQLGLGGVLKDILGEHDEAYGHLKAAVELDPGLDKAQYKFIDLLVNQHRLEEAQQRLDAWRAVAQQPGARDLIDELQGRVHAERGDFERAERELLAVNATADQKAVGAARPYRSCPYRALGDLYVKEGKSREAAAKYREAADADYQRPDLQFDAALQSFRAGEIAEARTYVQRALVLSRSADYRVFEAFLTAMSGGIESAEATFREALNDPSVAAAAHAGLGHTAILRLDYDAADEHLRAAEGLMAKKAHGGGGDKITRAPLDAFVGEMTQLGLGWANANRGRHEQAITHFDALLQTDPNHLSALQGKANSLAALGHVEEATALFEKVLRIDPNDAVALSGMAQLHASEGKDSLAQSEFEKAIKSGGEKFSCPYEGLGLLYLKQGQTEKGEANLKKAVGINPRIEYKKYNALARLAMEKGEWDRAEKLLRQSIENYPDDPEARTLLDELTAKKSP